MPPRSQFRGAPLPLQSPHSNPGLLSATPQPPPPKPTPGYSTDTPAPQDKSECAQCNPPRNLRLPQDPPQLTREPQTPRFLPTPNPSGPTRQRFSKTPPQPFRTPRGLWGPPTALRGAAPPPPRDTALWIPAGPPRRRPRANTQTWRFSPQKRRAQSGAAHWSSARRLRPPLVSSMAEGRNQI